MSVYYNSRGDTVDYTASTAKTAGDVVVQNNLVGIVTQDIAANQKGSLRIEGVAEVPKSTGGSTAIAAGKLVYWDATYSVATETSSGNTAMGVTVLAATDAAAVVYVKLLPGIKAAL